MDDKAVEKLAYSVKELCEVLGIGEPVAYELVKRPGFPSVRVSKNRIIIPVAPLKKWLERESEIGWADSRREMMGA